MSYETVLLVDDSKVVQAYFNQLINPLEFKLLIASNAKEANDFIAQDKDIGIAIVDISLPDAPDGAMVDYAINNNIPTIVLTGSRDQAVRELMMSKNIVDYMQKNSKDDFTNVVELMRRLVRNRNTKVLIVDDSTTFLMHLKQLLTRHLFSVVEAQNGKEALLRLEEHPDIAMVLTDYEMPEMDGLNLIQQIRKNHTRYDLPVMVLSTHDDGRKIANCLKSGANDYLHKPYKMEEFFSRVYMNLNNSANMLQIKEQQHLLKQYKNAIDETSIVSKADVHGRITFVNDMFCETSGYSEKELLGNTHNVVRHPDTPVETFKTLWKTILNKKVWHGVIKNRKKNGDPYIVDTTIIPILNANDEIEEFITIRKDITLVVEQNTIIQKLYTDPLTKLPNRQKLMHDLELTDFASLAIINIDSFNEINSFYGYELADRLLVEVAKKIKNFTSQTHYTYKLPVDEYAILGENVSEIEEKIFVFDLLEQLSNHSFMIDEHEIFLHFSVGIYSGVKDRLVNADIALQQAKVMKKDICAYGDLPDLNEIQSNNLKWIKKLHHAIEEGRIQAFFQPIVDNQTKKIEKYESLVRMMDGNSKPISPFFFLDIAKKTKLYDKLTKAVFDQTILLANKHKISFSVNLTVTDLKNTAMMESFCEEIQLLKLADYIVFEIVESEELESAELYEAVKRLKRCGIKISIDDFGTGYSNFDYLIKLNADFIKIDGSIVKKILTDNNSELIVKTIVNIAKELGAKTIAEFVESEAIYTKVKELGVDYSQGYYFSEPLENIIID